MRTASRTGARSDKAEPPGQYGAVVPPDPVAARERVRKQIERIGDGIGIGTGAVLDGEIDDELRGWKAELEAESVRRSHRLQDATESAHAALQAEEREQNRREEAYHRSRRALHEAYLRHTGRAPEPAPGDRAVPATTPEPVIESAAPVRLPAAASVAVHSPGRELPMEQGGRQYPYHGQIGGPMPGEYLHYLVLGIALAADFVAFYQILALVLGALPAMLVVVVLAVSLFSLWLTHQAGKTLREFRARSEEGGRIWIAVTCVLVWAILGAGAFTMRLAVDDDTGTASMFQDFGGIVSGTDETAVRMKALLFLAIYVTAGVVALIAAYLTWNPLRRAYRRALRGARRAQAALTRAQKRVGRAAQAHQAARRRQDSDAELHRAAIRHRESFACWLKRVVRQEIAVLLGDPEATRFLQEQPVPGCPPPPRTS